MIKWFQENSTAKSPPAKIYFIPFRSRHNWLKDFGATTGISLRSPQALRKNCLSMKFFSFAPPFSIVLRFSIAFFQKYQVQFSVLFVVF